MYPVNFVINFHFGCSSSRKLRILETFPSNSQWVVKSAAWLVQVQKLGQRQQLRDKVVVRFSLPCNLHAGSRTCSKLSLFKPTELRSTISKQKSQHNPTLRFQEKNKSQVHNLNLSNFYNFLLKENQLNFNKKIVLDLSVCAKELKVELHINYQTFALFFGKAANFWV